MHDEVNKIVLSFVEIPIEVNKIEERVDEIPIEVNKIVDEIPIELSVNTLAISGNENEEVNE